MVRQRAGGSLRPPGGELNKKEYVGSCYIGVVGPETDFVLSYESINAIIRRNGDSTIERTMATKGYEARQWHINKFIESHHDFIFLLDHDQIFEPDCLERLRSHKLPFVSGLYMRRQINPMAPVWFREFRGKWPLDPWIGAPERGKLHKLGASGWGCVLIHRDVILAVRELLKGEWEVLEDDMDIWPYDIDTVMAAIKGMRALVDEAPVASTMLPALDHHVKTLESEIRPLRADRDQIGSDIRFPFFALQAGYQLMGDPEVRCGHMLNYTLKPDDYDQLCAAAPDELAKAKKDTAKHVRAQRREMAARIEALT